MTDEARKARNEYAKKWRNDNRERLREYNKNWRKENPDKVAAAQQRYWTKKAGAAENGK